MAIGKLYKPGGDEFIVNVDYQLYDETKGSWWGELVPHEYRNIKDGDGYIIELENGSRSLCSLRKRVNRAVSGTPPLYHYQVMGRGRFEQKR